MAEIVTMPKLGFDMAEGVLIRWAVDVGGEIEKGQLLAEIETDKATVEVESPYAGYVLKHIVPEDSVVPINDPIAVIGAQDENISDLAFDDAVPVEKTDTEAEAAEKGDKTPTIPVAAPAEGNGQLPAGVRASPLARNMAASNNIDLTKVTGTGPLGRITKKDVQSFLAAAPVAQTPSTKAAPPALAVPTKEDQTVPLTRLRQAIGKRMTESKQWFPHFYVTYEYDLDSLMKMRKEMNEMLAEEGVKLSVNDFILKATALTLREFPNLNASLGENAVIQHGHINVGVAVAVEGGLLTVVCHDTDLKSLRQISTEVRESAGRVRSGKVHPNDVSGSTFTTSNLGMFGVDDFTAIINPPEAAILALGAARQMPVVVDGELAIGWRMKATISVDHRVSDGAEAAEFMRSMAKYLESPLRMLA